MAIQSCSPLWQLGVLLRTYSNLQQLMRMVYRYVLYALQLWRLLRVAYASELQLMQEVEV